ncbi:MAG TPA: metalloregulator ArsR/SmtB family transcription factor [Balneolales bacterium]|nr:metalloregulator ArsR/SmtB family transcription factor [Balneolales bacterium]
MAVTKASLFEEKDIQLADWAKALAHPARIAILNVLARRCTCLCGDITGELPLAQSTISQHLKVLKEAGLIQGEIDGVKVCYCLNPEVVKQLHEMLTSFTGYLSGHSDAAGCGI